MVNTIYIEEEIAEHPRTLEILGRFPKAVRIPCRRYGEVFNRKAQNFRLQKKQPALILARKFDNFVLPTPTGYGIGGERNFYFSHMLNCVYDCRYCFLQGMYRSAHYVVFVNYEDFKTAIDETSSESGSEATYFFSGYDCDSIALEPVTGFVESFLDFFAERPSALIELRTKSTQVKCLEEREPLPNCIVAYSLTPEEIGAQLEHKTPPVHRRLEMMVRLQEWGWKVGLRFDPVVYHPDYVEQYRRLYKHVFSQIRLESLHSVSLGPFRLPKEMYETMFRLYPEERLFSGPLVQREGMVSYGEDLEEEMLGFCKQELLEHIPEELFFRCEM